MVETGYDTIYPPETLYGVLEEKICLLGTISRGLRSQNMNTITIYQSNNKTIRVYVKTAELLPQILTGATAVMIVKKTKADVTASIQKSTAVVGQGAITDPINGEVEFYLIPTDTATLNPQQYIFDVKITLSNGKVYTVVEGLINLKQVVG